MYKRQLQGNLFGPQDFAACVFVGEEFVIAAVDFPNQLVGFGTFALKEGGEILPGDPAVGFENGRQLLKSLGGLVIGRFPAEHF